jgi:hypothetical protein
VITGRITAGRTTHRAAAAPSASIVLSRKDIDGVLPRVRAGLEQYLALREAFRRPNAAGDRSFRKAFNHFYRVRRGPEWQDVFFREFGRHAAGRAPEFGSILNRLHQLTGRVEASFASKLVATVDPRQPVIDSVVLRQAGLRLRRTGPAAERISRAVEVHGALADAMTAFLTTDRGRYLVAQFERRYPGSGVTEIKMLDLVLWQTRE